MFTTVHQMTSICLKRNTLYMTLIVIGLQDICFKKKPKETNNSKFVMTHLIPEKFIMMRRDEIDSAHIVHKGGAYPTPSVIHTNVSLIK